MSPRPDVSEERKDQIIQAATVVFARAGFQKARMDDIAVESGLSKGALYWYFESKDDIIIAIVENFLERSLSVLENLQYAAGSAQARLTDYVELTLADFKEIMGFMPMFYEFFAMALRSEVIQGLFRSYFRRYIGVIIPIIEQGIEEGEFRAVNPQDTALAIGALLEGMILIYSYDPSYVNIEKHTRGAFKLLLEGLLLPES